jgi:dienelactone hydrolase
MTPEIVAKRDSLRTRLVDWYGAIPDRGDLDVHEEWRREFFTHTEIKLSYQGEPNERIPAYLLLPRTKTPPPWPAVYAAHQCHCYCDIGKEQVVGKFPDAPDQAYGYELVKEGFVVLAPDANKIGERYDPQRREPWERAQGDWIDHPRLGHTWGQAICCCGPGGALGPVHWKRVFDIMKGIDLLERNEMVDPSRIGMIGHSLGACATLCGMSMDRRIRAGVISGAATFEEDVDYGYGLSYADVLWLIAPRPMLEVAGTQDWPGWGKGVKAGDPVDVRMRAKRDAHAAARTVYAAHGNGSGLALHEFEGEHVFPETARRTSYDWLKRWLSVAKAV